jgi:MoaD family protein
VLVTVRLFSHLRLALGKRSLDLELSKGATVSDVIEQMRVLTGPNLESLFVESPEGSCQMLILVNGRATQSIHALHEGDVISLLASVGGG